MINWIVTSSVLIVVVAGLRFVLRGKISLRLQYALWLVVLFRLLVPFEIGTSDLSLMNVMEQVPVVQEMESLENVESISYYEADGTVYGNRTFEEDAWPTVAVNQTEADFHRMEKELVLRDAADVVWKIGMAVMAFAFLFVNFRFKKRLERERKQIPVEDCRLPVYVSDLVETPCLFGLIQPAIYVTPEAASDEIVLRHTIEHETTHYLQKDHIWSFLRCAALCFHWYNPLVWWAVKLSKEDGELACDEATIARIGEEERYAYGKTLIEMTKPGRNVLLGTATTMTGSKSALKERIERIAKKPKMAAYTLAAVLVIAVAAVVCTMTGAEDQKMMEWLDSVQAEDIIAQITYENGAEASSYMLKEKDKEELCQILNQIKRRNIREEKEVSSFPTYQMIFHVKDEEGILSPEFVFQVKDEATVSLFFNEYTENPLLNDGRYWCIQSSDLAAFIEEKVELKGTEVMTPVEITRADVDDDGVQEIIAVREYLPEVYRLSVAEQDGTVIWEEDMGLSHVGWGCMLLYHEGQTEYLMRYSPYVNQGEAGYDYRIYHVKDGEADLYYDDSVGFTYYSDEPFDTEVTAFLNTVNGYLGSSTILLSTLDGVPEIGPTSTQKLMDENKELLNHRTEKGQPPANILQVMESIREEDITEMGYVGNISKAELVKTLNDAASSQVTYDEAVSWGHSLWPSYYQLGWIHLDSGLQLTLQCGLTENIVEIRYGRPSLYFSAYFQNENLYHLVRHYRDYEQIVDREDYARFQSILDRQMEECFEAMKTNSGMFYDYKLKRFNRIWFYEEEDGARVELYDFDYALLTDNPDQIGWAGGMYLDSEGDVQGFNGGGQFAVRLRNGKRVAHFFLGNDLYYTPGENEVFIKETLLGMLNHSEENGGV